MATNHSSSRRLFVLGDPHISPFNESVWREEVVRDINALRPERVLVLGDLSGGAQTGTAAGTRLSVEILNALDAPWSSIIGNHDLQSDEFPTDEAAVAMMLDCLGRPHPGFVVEEDGFAIIGLDNTFWRRNSINPNEIVIDDAQLEWWRAELARLGDKPVVMLGHAPPIGSGLVVLPELHARVGNAYMNQNHDAGRIQQIIWEHPNILFWFSGHNHLGQHYRDALGRRLGVLYAHTGTASIDSARDGHRHSRVLEIGPRGIRVRTFDHGLRSIDADLDYEIPLPLETLVSHRKRLLGKRFVPRNPTTMSQESELSERDPATRRFVFLSDVHAVLPLPAIAGRLADWATRHIRALDPDDLVLGGDLTHQAEPAQAEAFLDRLGLPEHFPAHYLPGNNEGSRFGLAAHKVVRGCETIGPNVYLLATSDADDTAASVEALLGRISAKDASLVFAHFPPELARADQLERLRKAAAPVFWICGHRHSAQSRDDGSLRVEICGGLDAVKVRGARPEILQVDWDGNAASCSRHSVPEKFIRSPNAEAAHFRIGFAIPDTPEDILRAAIAHTVSALEFRASPPDGWGGDRAEQSRLMEEYRRAVPDAFGLLRLPVSERPDDGALDLDGLASCLDWAEEMRLDTLSLRLPDLPTRFLFGVDRAWAKGEGADRCVESHVSLVRRVLGWGGWIYFENVDSRQNGASGADATDDAERLGSRPWHLTHFVERVRAGLREAACSEAERDRVGILFDAPVAFTDSRVSKLHGLADWVGQLAPVLRAVRIYQINQWADVRDGNRRPIDTPHGPLINYEGFLAALADGVPVRAALRLPVLIGAPDCEGALLGRKTLLRGGAR